MKTVSRLRWILSALLAVAALPAYSDPITWTNVAGGNWSQALNWNPNQVPGSSDDASITAAGTYAVVLDVAATVNSLTLGGSTGQQILTNGSQTLTLNNASTVSTHGYLQLSAGATIGGSGSLTNNGICDVAASVVGGGFALTVATNGVLNFLGGGNTPIQGTLVNWGAVFWQGGTLQVFNNGTTQTGVITNEPGATWNIQCDQPLYIASGGEQFVNMGIIRKTAGLGTTTIYAYLVNNGGILDTRSGTNVLDGGSDLGGSLMANTNSGITLGGGNYTNGPAVNFTGAGTFQMVGGNLTLVTNLVPRLQLNGGNIFVDPTFQNGTITNLNMTGSILMGTNTVEGTLSVRNGSINGMLTVEGGALVNATNTSLSGVFAVGENAVMNWAGGTLSGGALNVAPDGVLNLQSFSQCNLYSPLTNQGTVNWLGNTIVVVNDGDTNDFGAIWNEPGALWNIESDQYLSCNYCTTNEMFHNSGTIRKINTAGTTGAGTTFLSLFLANSGVVEAEEGIIQFNGGSDMGGSFVADAQASIYFGGGNFAINPQLGFSGAGTFAFVAGNVTLFSNTPANVAFTGGNVSLDPSFQGGVITNLSLQGATLLGTNTVNGSLNLFGGGANGALNVAEGTVTATNATFTGPVTVASNAVFNWAGGYLQTGSPLTVAHGGVLNLELNPYSYFYFYGPLTNQGTVNWEGMHVYLGNDGALNTGAIWNEATGVWDIQCDGYYIGCASFCYGDDVFHNLGLLEKTLTAGTSTISDFLDNSGTVEAQTGTIQLADNSPLTGSFVAETNATIALYGNFTNGPSVNFSGAGSFQLAGGTLTLLSNVIPNLQLIGGNLTLDPTFQGGVITNLTLNGATLVGTNNVNGSLVLQGGGINGLVNVLHGSLTLNNGSFSSGSVEVNPGTTLNATNTTFSGAFTVASNAVFNWAGGALAAGSSLAVAPGGVLNLEPNIYSQFYLQGPLTNQGTVNWTGMTIYLQNNTIGAGAYAGAIWNEAGGLWNIQCDQTIGCYWCYGDEFFYNLGVIEKSITTGITPIQVFLENSGTVEAETGTIQLTDGGDLGGSMIAETNGVIALNAGNYTNGPSVNFSGAGSFQMTGGSLTLITNPIPNLQLMGGTVTLSSNFQGGMITNLTLDGANLVGTNLVTGTLNASNSLITGSLTVASGGVFNFAGGGLDQASALTVAAGGTLNLQANPVYSYPYYGYLYFESPVTNAGTVNWQSGGIYVANDNSAYFGAIWNQPGGLWNAECDQTLQYLWNYGYDAFHNAGTFRKSAGIATTTLATFYDNVGTLDVESGTVLLNGVYAFESSGTLNFGINDSFDYGQLSVPTNAALAGTLSATLNGGFVPEEGDSFDVFNYGTSSGAFGAVNLPKAVSWQTTIGPTAVTLEVLNPLALAAIPNQAAVQLANFTLAVTASDGNVPPETLTFSLVSGPNGMTINSGTGVISWTPPSGLATTNTVVVGVTDNGSPALTNSTSFVIVSVPNHANVTPVLSAIGTQTINEFTSLTVANAATDSDAFATVTYSLTAAPPGAAISSNGVITWTPSQTQSPSTNTFTTLATSTDPYANNSHVLTGGNTFTVIVKEVNLAPQLPILPPQTVNELTSISVTNAASEPNMNASTTGYALINPPAGAAINASGVFTWTPTQAQSPSTNFITAVVTNTDAFDTTHTHLTATNTFTVVVVEVNVAPTLGVITAKTVNELTPLLVTNAAGETDIHATLAYSLVNPPAGATINSNGVISWTPAQTQSTNSYTFQTIVNNSDIYDQVTPHLSATNSFTVSVKEVNVAPSFVANIPPQTVPELTLLTVTNAATNSNIHATNTSYSLLNAPAGAAISASGVFTWTPTQAESPSTNTITNVVVNSDTYDTVNPTLSTTNTFTVIVKEVNVAPTLGVIATQTVTELNNLAVNNAATETDIHAMLAYTLISPPAGASINASGMITWTPSQTQSPSTNIITTVVTNTDAFDTNNPHLSATNSFTVIVTESNMAPVLPVIANTNINELTLLMVTNAATEPNIHAVTTSYTLVNPPAGATIDSRGVIIWTPSQPQSGSGYTFTTIVSNSDLFDAVTPQRSATNSFTVTVKEVNVAPVLGNIGAQSVNELATLTVTNAATESNIHATTTGYGLVSPTPANAVISASGVITWTPTQAQSTNTYTFTTVVTNTDSVDNSHLTATNSFPVTVVEVNVAPSLPVISQQTVNELTLLTVTNTATNSNIHATNAGYALLDAPNGAAISASGVVTWTPAQTQSPSTNTFVVAVTNTDTFDTVNPHLSSTNIFTVVVVEVNQAPTLPAITTQTITELNTLTVTNTATEANTHATLAYTLVNPPAGASISSNGVITWTPSQSQSGNSYVLTTQVTNTDVFDLVSPHLTANNSFTVNVTESNMAPVLGNIGAQSVNELATLTVTNAATESNIHATTTGYGLVSPTPANAVINASGVITWTPTQAQSTNTYTFVTVVTNTDSVDNSHLTATNSFPVTVVEVNVAPSLPVISQQTVNELTLLTVTNTATNSNIHATNTGYALLDAPNGAAISASGVVTWTPAQTQSPSTNTFVVAVTNTDTFDTINPHLSSTNIFTVVVVEVNQAPTLPANSTNTIAALTPLTLTNTAADSDIHATLSYTLVTPPAGAVISSNGIITWTPGFAQGKSTNQITTVVTATDLLDAINSQKNATNTITVIVTPPSVTITSPKWLGNGQFRFSFTASSGAGYDVQSSTDLIHWTTILVLDPGPGGPVTVEDPNATTSQRYYRIVVTAP